VRGEPVQDRLQVVEGPQVELHVVAILAGDAALARPGLLDRLPPPSFFLVSAVFHYLGPSFAVAGVAAIADIRLAGQPLGFAFAFGNCALFMLYVILGHKIANGGRRAGPDGAAGPGRTAMSGIDQLGAAMLVAAVAITPAGLGGAVRAMSSPLLLLAGLGVGVCSSVIPYVTDQLAMARLPRATFALMLALLPVFATLTGAVILGQVPTVQDAAGIGLVVAGLALHRGPAEPGTAGTPPGE
jgi:inner membrane transporter RhtA